MQAVGMTEFGGPEVLKVVDRPMPVPGPGEVRVRVAAAGVNPTDVWIRAGRSAKALADIPPPWTPGMELAGTIDAVGPEVQWAIGDRVMAIVIPLRLLGGAQAEHVVVPATSVAIAPASLDMLAAAVVPLNALTARLALDKLALPAGASLGVIGATGALGRFAIQLAKFDGLRVVADASPADEALVSGLGADAVVPRGGDMAALRSAAPGGLDALLDCAVLGAALLPAIRDGGQLAAVRAFREESERGIEIRQVWISEYVANQRVLQHMAQLAADGVLTSAVAGTFAPDHAADAHRRLEAGGVRGRLLVVFD
jgi:NADPH:quinone reductase-like Zn-dependent oxidoreductase